MRGGTNTFAGTAISKSGGRIITARTAEGRSLGMDDLREKVINALGRCESYGYCEDKQCPYYENTGCLELLRKDTLSMLREQEPVKPIIKHEMDDVCSCIDNVAYCGKCGEPIGRLKKNYCSNCGRKVAWND